MRLLLTAIVLSLWAGSATAESAKGDFLVKMAPNQIANMKSRYPAGTVIENLGIGGWVRVQLPADARLVQASIASQPGVLAVQKNHRISLMDTWSLKTKAQRDALKKVMDDGGGFPIPGGGGEQTDNPAIPAGGTGGTGADPLYAKQWGMNQMSVKESWTSTKGRSDMIVAVIDTGVAYTHEDLVDAMWRNPGET